MIEPASENVIRSAAQALGQGRLVAFPTETVYGLGADATNAEAVARIFDAKGRPRFDPLIVHVASIDQVKQLVANWPSEAAKLASTFWPGPLTLVLPKNASVIPDIVTAGLNSVAIRMPDHSVAQALIQAAGKPIAAPSANRFGMVSPTCAQHVAESFANDQRVACIIDGGPCRVGVESTVVSLVDPHHPLLLRPGGVSTEQLEETLGQKVETAITADSGAVEPVEGRVSPGMLDKHYATRTPLFMAPAFPEGVPAKHVARMILGPSQDRHFADDHEFALVRSLSERSDLIEAAANLFRIMREIDAMPGIEAIVADEVPDRGIGIAINDRLRRASTR